VNPSQATARHDVTRSVLEYEIGGVEDAVHGVTFAGPRLIVASGTRLARLVPQSGRVVDHLETFPARGGLAYDGRHLWQHIEGRFQQLEVRTGLVVRSVAVALHAVTGLEWLDADLLVLHDGGRSLARVELVDHAEWVEAIVAANVVTSTPMSGLTWALGELWTSTAGALVAIEPASARATMRVSLPAGVRVGDLAGDTEGRLWCVDGQSRVVRVFAPARQRERRPFERPRSTATSDVPGHPPSGAMPVSKAAGAQLSAAEGTFRRLLVPVDFSPASGRALATALVLRERLGSEVHLFHLTEHGANDEFLAGTGAGANTPGELVEAARARLRRYVDHLFPGRAADVEVHAHYGTEVARGIARTAEEIGATLVLLAGKPRQSLFRTPIEKIERDLRGDVMVLIGDNDGASAT
jgi:nucleotide-binding universal stress UspA family protein